MPKKQQDGRYRAKITIGHDAAGKTLYKYVSGTTKRELEEAKAEARAYYIDGAVQQEDRLFRDYAMQWYKAKKEPHLSASSRASYNTYFNKHLFPAFGDRMLRAIQPLELQLWLNQHEGKSKTVIIGLLTILKGVFGSALAEGIIPRDVSLSLIRPKATPPDERRALTEEEKQQVEEVIANHDFGIFLAVLYYTGMRRGEALGLKWGDIDWDADTIRVQRDIDYTGDSKGREDENLKTKAAYREVPLIAELRNILYPHRGLPYMLLFATKTNAPLPYATFLRRWMSLMIACGFATPVKHDKTKQKKKPDLRYDWKCDITPHMFRHNFATMLYDAGIDPILATKILGHADYATTARIYTHLNQLHLGGVAEKISIQFNGQEVAEKVAGEKSCRKVAKQEKQHAETKNKNR